MKLHKQSGSGPADTSCWKAEGHSPPAASKQLWHSNPPRCQLNLWDCPPTKQTILKNAWQVSLFGGSFLARLVPVACGGEGVNLGARGWGILFKVDILNENLLAINLNVVTSSPNNWRVPLSSFCLIGKA